MEPEAIYLEAIKRAHREAFGAQQTTRRRVLELTVATLRGGEFTVDQIRAALNQVCPPSVSVPRSLNEAANLGESFALLERKNQAAKEKESELA